MSEIVSPTDLADEELSAVCFVQDYVELDFNGPILRALAPVTIMVAERRWTYPEDGSRDALCSIIGRTVSSVEVEEGVKIAVRFDEGTTEILIPLSEQMSPSGEAAHFLPEIGGPLQVW